MRAGKYADPTTAAPRTERNNNTGEAETDMKAFMVACAIAICGLTGTQAQAQTAPAQTTPSVAPPTSTEAPPKLAAREAGARYGQALGVALVCYGLRTTAVFDRLPESYTDANRVAFQEESDKVLSAWRQASSCQNAGGPNSCRLLHDWSCRDAVLEIGPNGSKLPGLIEAKHD